MRIILKGLIVLASVLYPFLILWVLYSHREYLPVACLVGMAVLIPVAIYRRNGSKWRLAITIAALCILGAVRLSGDPDYLKLYPILVSALMLFQFAWSLAHPPSLVEQLARLAQRGKELPPQASRYCRTVTKVWVGFFCLNIVISALTALCGSWEIWALYNGGISYVLMGLLVAGEWLIRRRLQARTTP